MNAKHVLASAALLGAALSAAAAHAQTADCDFANGAVDLFINARFEDYLDCPSGSGLPCTQGPNEADLVGWGVTLATGPGTTGATGVTNGVGDTAWTSNGGLTNTCVAHGPHTITLTVPSPSPYDPAASWPSNLTFNFTINPTDATTGLPIERFFLSVYFTCQCASDGDACTNDRCTNGLCPYVAVAYDATKPEVCNDRDDDCDGDTDEGLPATAPDCTNASLIGCADKTREGFMTWDDFPLIAACGGAWGGAGVDGDPSCARAAGNHGTSALGATCSAADLCPAGWHVCYGPEDVAQRLANGDCSDAVDPFYPNFGSGALASEVSVPPGGAFFASAARSLAGVCDEGVNGGALGSASEVFGCGNMGTSSDSCGFFDRVAGALCGGLRDVEPTLADDPATDYGYAVSNEWAWSCGGTAGDELTALRKTLPEQQGGVLCCKDSDASLTEVCDRIDNDADGSTDETTFSGGPLITVGDTCLKAPGGSECGVLGCSPAGGWVCSGTRACADTTCDGVDDDGDGQTDEEYVATVTACGEGACAAVGQLTCFRGGELDDCEPGPASADDTSCDGEDSDCDGQTDEDFAAGPSTCGVGACAATGLRACSGGVASDSCTPGVALSEDDVTCDGSDDDCDGSDDDEVVASPTTCGLGACAATGSESCVDGSLVDSCTPGAAAASDATCDGSDDDCDGASDEDFVARVTTCGIGACADNSGSVTCADGVESDSCDPLAGATSEVCNDADDDCDGASDEGFAVGEACDGDDSDACETGVIVCSATFTAQCDETGTGVVEVCDGQDNDCDGDTDEGLAGAGCSDKDEDTVPDSLDNCVDIPNTDQVDSDSDGDGDACDVVAQGGACQTGPADLAGLLLALALLAATRRIRSA